MKAPQEMETTVYRKDYQSPVYLIPHIDLVIDLDETKTIVKATSKVKLNNGKPGQPLKLDGDNQKLLSIAINGVPLEPSSYRINPNTHQLIIDNVPPEFDLEIVCEINPTENRKKAHGLYFSGGQFVTHNEAEGFRGITYFVDRPDNLATYTTEIRAPKEKYPVLLANGNLSTTTALPDGRHAVQWFDPIPKPSYLFALVGGNLMAVEDHFITQSGKDVSLKIFVPKEDIDKTLIALESLKQSLRWKENVYGIEYDLNTYMIAEAQDFNAGAMENKGLNIFNRSGLLAHKETSLDNDVTYVRTAVAHECAHNEFGNRTSPRSWFELFIKEGWATYLEQKCHAYYLGDLASRQRINTINAIRLRQFAEEESAMGHAVQLDAYTEIDNFYTLTTYYKGAELLHVLERYIGSEAMVKGVQYFLENYDGQSVYLDNVLTSMEWASGKNLNQFRLWYTQAGTPEVIIKEKYIAEEEKYVLTFEQYIPNKVNEPEKLPVVIPMSIALFDQLGAPISCFLEGEKTSKQEMMLIVDQHTQDFTFTGIQQKPILSALRDFSAPIKVVKSPTTLTDLEVLMSHESNMVQRWDAAQQLFTKSIKQLLDMSQGKENSFYFPYEAIKTVLCDTSIPAGIRADILTPPSLNALMQSYPGIAPEELNDMRILWKQIFAGKLHHELIETYHQISKESTENIEPNDASLRALKNICLSFLSSNEEASALKLLKKQFLSSRNLTDRIVVVTELCNGESQEWQQLGDQLLNDLYQKWKHEPLVIEIWLSTQASILNTHVVDRVRTLMDHPAFDISNPNCVRELLRTFTRNPIGFHKVDGSGYQLIAEAVLRLDQINFSMAADICRHLTEWSNLDTTRQHLMIAELLKINQQETLTKGVREIVTNGLKAAREQGLLPEHATKEPSHTVITKLMNNCQLMRDQEKGNIEDELDMENKCNKARNHKKIEML